MRTPIVIGFLLGTSLAFASCKEGGTDCTVEYYDDNPDDGGNLVESEELPYDDIDDADEASLACEATAAAEIAGRDDVSAYRCMCSTR